jgi:hypothetical protein
LAGSTVIIRATGPIQAMVTSHYPAEPANREPANRGFAIAFRT